MATFIEKLTVFTKLYGKSFFLLIIIILFFAAAVETDAAGVPLEQEPLKQEPLEQENMGISE